MMEDMVFSSWQYQDAFVKMGTLKMKFEEEKTLTSCSSLLLLTCKPQTLGSPCPISLLAPFLLGSMEAALRKDKV